MIIYDCVLTNTAPDDTVDELDFSLFTSSEFSYDALADLSLTFDDSDMEVVIDISDSREMEERSIARFAQDGCSCKHFDGGPCCKLFSVSHYQEVRDQCRELTRSELDLVVMGQLLALTHSGHMTQAKKHIQKERTRSFTYFKHGGHTICIKTFCFLHTIGQLKFKAIKASFERDGLVPRQHRSHKPRHALRLADIQYVVTFITNYAEDHAILLPGRIPGYKRDDVILLPSSTTKKAVWEFYHIAAESASDVRSRAVGYSSFCSLWEQILPHIIVCKPMSDLCWTCQQNSTMIMRAHNRPEGEKSDVSTIVLFTNTLYLINAHHIHTNYPKYHACKLFSLTLHAHVHNRRYRRQRSI